MMISTFGARMTEPRLTQEPSSNSASYRDGWREGARGKGNALRISLHACACGQDLNAWACKHCPRCGRCL
jgi:hypothetical protein